MAGREERYVRFHDWKSEQSVSVISDRVVSEKGHNIFGLLKDRTAGAFSFLGNSSHSEALNKLGLGEKSKTKVLDPQGPFLQRWNKIFVISCLFAVFVDPLFLYVPVIDGGNNCLYLDKKLETTASILRFFTDIFYLLHILFQFRTGFIAPSSRVFGRGALVKDTFAIAKRYLSTLFLVDFLAVLPLPQVFVLVVLPKLQGPEIMKAKIVLLVIIICQYVPRLLRIIPLYLQITRSAGILTETAWAGAAFNLIIYMLASHGFGALWYILSIQREDTCWRQACINQTGCDPTSLYCGSLGQNMKTSTNTLENLFAVFVSTSGLVLFALLIGNVQTYLQSASVRIEEMRVKRRDTEQWMAHRLLPENLKDRIMRHEQYRWQETRGVDEEGLLKNLPKDLRREIKRHLCLSLLMKVPMFENMDEQLLDAMCDRLKPMLYTEGSCIIREGDPVNEMLFIMRGTLESTTTNGGQTGFFNSNVLKGGDFCGEELLTWALDPTSASNLPGSTRTVKTLSEVEAFALRADDLKFVATQFRRLHSKQLQHTFRFYSQQWRTWAACFIQAAWHRYCRKKLEEALYEKEKRLQAAIVSDGTTSLSLGAALYASRFAGNMMRILRRNATRKARLQERVPARLLQKPAEPNFFAEDS
uniref:Cyclic nucleotide-binding domain-containing protein n=1 Tax=Zea mays TaxID=4577 RepID=A0A804P2K8_MAIZE